MAIRQFLSHSQAIWKVARDLDRPGVEKVLAGMHPPDRDGPTHVTKADGVILYASVAGADRTLSDDERELFDRYTAGSDVPTGGEPLLDFLSTRRGMVPYGYRALLAFDLDHGTRLSTYYARAVRTFVTMLKAAGGASRMEEAALVTEIEERIRAAAREAGGPEPLESRLPRHAALEAEMAEAGSVVEKEETEREKLEPLLQELDKLIGLEAVKHQVRLLTDFVHIQNVRREAGLPTRDLNLHLSFTGNPGTGKTTVARILSRIFNALGVVSKGHLVEVDRSHLVASYVGQTAPKVRERVEEALGGVLFIDEAYSLVSRGEQDFGREAVDTLVKLMEDNRDDLVVIFAGYPEPMEELIESNPGLSSRIRTTIHFDDFTDEQLIAIFEMMCDDNGYMIGEEARQVLLERLQAAERGEGFGNARMIRNWFEDALTVQASRLVRSGKTDVDSLKELTAEDVGSEVAD